MSRDIRILCIKTTDNCYQPLAWTDREISNKKLRRLVHKFRADADFLKGIVIDWYRFYDTIQQVKNELPRI